MGRSSSARSLLTAAMNVIILIAVVLAARLVIEFFGALSSTGVGSTLIDLTDFMAPDLGFPSVRTPYGGVFEVGTGVVIVGLLAIEAVLALVRSRG